MKELTWPPKCGDCGRFVKLAHYFTYTRYGHVYEEEPPEPTYLCEKCGKNADVGLINAGAWLKFAEVDSREAEER